MAEPRVTIDLDIIERNARAVTEACARYGVSVFGVTKGTCGTPQVAAAMLRGGAFGIGESRFENIQRLRQSGLTCRILLLRSPPLSRVDETVTGADISLNSELAVIEKLSRVAVRRSRIHDIILMVDLGDLREGIWPDDLLPTVARIVQLPGVRLVGLGTNLTCFGAVRMPWTMHAKAAIIGAPLDLGAGRRGVDMGPSAIRYAGLEERLTVLGVDCIDRGNVETAVAEATAEDDSRARFLPAIRATCEGIAGLVGAALDEGRIPIVLGGDHSIALGTLGGLASRRGPGAVLWFDAHGDLNTPETTPSGNVHGMPLAAALGRGGPGFDSPSWTLPALQPERVAVIGARELDSGERALIGELGLAVHTMSELDRRGIETVVSEALERAAGAPFVHVSLDLDGLDPDVAPGVGTPVRGGLTYREAHLAMELVAESGLLCCLEIVEVNPILDRANATAALAVELAASAFGATTL